MSETHKEPRIILFDIEIIPDLKKALKHWTRLSDYPGKTMKADITSIACVGWKVLGHRGSHCINAWDFDGWKTNVNDDKELCEEIRKVLDGADAVVTHFGKRFDWKYVQTRLAIHGLPLLPRINHIDTCLTARANFTAFSNALGHLGELLVNEGKLQHAGWEMWVKTHNRDAKALRDMERYCKQDVNLLEKVFNVMRPLFLNIPNYNLWIKDENSKNCPSCGSFDLISHGYRATKTMKYRRMQCRDCGSTSRTDVKGLNPRSI